MLRSIILSAGFVVGVSAGLSGCASISQPVTQQACADGSLDSVGYADGRKGKSFEEFSKVTETCNEFGIEADKTQYLAGYDQGLSKHCTSKRGFQDGKSGYDPQKECRIAFAVDYLDGYDRGVAEYSRRAASGSCARTAGNGRCNPQG